MGCVTILQRSSLLKTRFVQRVGKTNIKNNIKAKMQDSVSNAPLTADRFNEASSFDSASHDTYVILVRVCRWLVVVQ